jgi:hypothetical protein
MALLQINVTENRYYKIIFSEPILKLKNIGQAVYGMQGKIRL